MSSPVTATVAVFEMPGPSAPWVGVAVGLVVLGILVATVLVLRRRRPAPPRVFDDLPTWGSSSTDAPLAFPRSDPPTSWQQPLGSDPPASPASQIGWSGAEPAAQDPSVPVVLHVSSLPPSVAPRFPGGWVMLRAVEVHGTWPAGAAQAVASRPIDPNRPPPLPPHSVPSSPGFDARPHDAPSAVGERRAGPVPLPDSLVEELLRGR